MTDFLALPHCLAVVVSQHSRDGPVVGMGGGGDAAGGGEELDQQTLVVLKDATPPTTSTWLCVPFAKLSTNTREWKALHSMRSHSLLPLVPYLLYASPIVSASRLQAIYGDIERGISSIVQTEPREGSSDSNSRKGQVEREERLNQVIQLLETVKSSIQVNISVLAVTNMPEKFKALIERKGLNKDVRNLLEHIRKQWKKAVKDDHKDSAIAKLAGGNVITASALGGDDDLHRPPPVVSPALWNVLTRAHNTTQLFAIKHVVSSMEINDVKNDSTRICLIQGPPGICCQFVSASRSLMFVLCMSWAGTGKTRTILGMVSALMHLCLPTTPVAVKSSGIPAATGDVPVSGKSPTHRLLVCAPSNAAVDEVLLRLLTEGVVNREGRLAKPKLVRLGAPLDNCPKEILDLTLENQIEKYLQRDEAWKKLKKATELTTTLKNQLAAIDLQSFGAVEQRRKLRADIRLAHGTKIIAELQVSLRRHALRKTLLETCDVLAGA